MTEEKELFTFEETIKFRPRCLYQDTCLHLKQKTRECKDCIHYKDYWREVVEKEQKERIKRLEQENKELKEKIKDKPLQCLLYNDKQNKCALFTKTVAYHCALEEIRKIAEDVEDASSIRFYRIKKKINEVLNEGK